MLLSSPAFKHEDTIPSRYTCEGESINPPLALSYVPPKAQTLVLVVEDPDAPLGLWIHWLVWNISANITAIEEGSAPKGVVGKNSGQTHDWYPICPPDEKVHRYIFRVFALDCSLNLDPETTKLEELHSAMDGHILAKADVVGHFQKTVTEETK